MNFDTTTDPRSSDFSYKKYSLEQLDNWVNDAVNCEDLTPQDIYDTIVKCVNESVEYHRKYYTKSVELLSLLKGHRNVDFDYTATGEKFPRTAEKKREYELKEREFERKRAMLDAQSTNFPDYTEL